MIRILTLNIWQEQGPWPERMELLERRLPDLSPDVICLQEVRDVAGRVPNQAATLARSLGLHWTFEPAQSWGGGDEGLAILSRHPLSGRAVSELPGEQKRSRRICLGAQVESPEGAFWIFTTHLAFRLDDGALRERQVLEVAKLVRAHHQSERATVLTGDFNAVPGSDEIRFLRGLTTLQGRRAYYQDAFVRCNPGVAGYTWCRENPYTAELAWLEPDRRLDYVFVTPMTRRGAGTVHACRIVLDEPDPRGIWCSDHYGVLATLSVAAVTPV